LAGLGETSKIEDESSIRRELEVTKEKLRAALEQKNNLSKQLSETYYNVENGLDQYFLMTNDGCGLLQRVNDFLENDLLRLLTDTHNHNKVIELVIKPLARDPSYTTKFNINQIDNSHSILQQRLQDTIRVLNDAYQDVIGYLKRSKELEKRPPQPLKHINEVGQLINQELPSGNAWSFSNKHMTPEFDLSLRSADLALPPSQLVARIAELEWQLNRLMELDQNEKNNGLKNTIKKLIELQKENQRLRESNQFMHLELIEIKKQSDIIGDELVNEKRKSNNFELATQKYSEMAKFRPKGLSMIADTEVINYVERLEREIRYAVDSEVLNNLSKYMKI
jgi:hypothetical protein